MSLKKERDKLLQEMQLAEEIKHLKAAQNRARSITAGTAFGGSIEITMRGSGDDFLYSILQPVEAVEFIHQLAAAAGCHLQLVPRKDFASWRDWKVTEEDLLHFRGPQTLPGVGHPLHANDMAPHSQVGAALPPPEEQKGIPLKINKDKKDAVAIKKTVNKRKPKRSRATSK
tara:strand:- start:666 stop:1181 length:516 start_codon:yes stop_codon:yes gene_type:complete